MNKKSGLVKCKSSFTSDNFNFEVDVIFQLNAFSEYIKLTNEIIDQKVKSKITEYQELDKKNDMFFDMTDFEIKINTHQLFYNSLFVSLFSFLERSMYKLCKLAESKHHIKIKDLSETGVYLYKKYLKLVLKIDFVPLNKEWTEISKLNDLRNLIIHGPTTIVNKNNKPQLITTLKNIKGLSSKDLGDSIDFYIEELTLLNTFSKTIHNFLSEIYFE